MPSPLRIPWISRGWTPALFACGQRLPHQTTQLSMPYCPLKLGVSSEMFCYLHLDVIY